MVNFVEVDVRTDIKEKKEPFDKIMGAVKTLKEDQSLVLHAPFEPVPLHKVMQRKGFSYEVEEIEKEHWRVTYKRDEEA